MRKKNIKPGKKLTPTELLAERVVRLEARMIGLADEWVTHMERRLDLHNDRIMRLENCGMIKVLAEKIAKLERAEKAPPHLHGVTTEPVLTNPWVLTKKSNFETYESNTRGIGHSDREGVWNSSMVWTYRNASKQMRWTVWIAAANRYQEG